MSSINTLGLYSLSPGTTSAFKNVRLCKDLCPLPPSETSETLTSGAEESSEEPPKGESELFFYRLDALTNEIVYLSDPFVIFE
jgi:hypothetical protein